MERIYAVSEVNAYVKTLLTQDRQLCFISIRGEVSNCKYHTSGHVYFTLKDEKGQLPVVLFAGQRAGLSFPLTEGQRIIVLGSIGLYERDGKYQLYARQITLDGIGALYQNYALLKIKLEKEGLFDSNQKKKIPDYPKKVGIITAKTGAAIQDMIQIIGRRNPYLQIILYPALVQGEGAVESIVKGIQTLDQKQLDVLIVGRGGGSIEDLWAFNEEDVARAIFACQTPIISAVGHEIDTTIADLVADLRAPTPSAAAELVTKRIQVLFDQLRSYFYAIQHCMQQKLFYEHARLQKQTLRFKQVHPIDQIRQQRQGLIAREERLAVLMQRKQENRTYQWQMYRERLQAVSPLVQLEKGYAIIKKETGAPFSSVKAVSKEERLQIELKDGTIFASVQSIKRRRKNGKNNKNSGTII